MNLADFQFRSTPFTRYFERSRKSGLNGFTLIELILVMTILVIVLSVSAPSLSRFFRGRTLDSEAKRFLALTRYGQSRAVSEGLPILVWIDAQAGTYGLQADSSYVQQDDKTYSYQLNSDVQVQVPQSQNTRRAGIVWKGTGGLPRQMSRIRFTPDGFVSDTSPSVVVFRGKDQGEIWIGESQTRTAYEIQTNFDQNIRR